MRLLARIYILVSVLFIVLYGVLPGFFRVEGNFIAYYVAGKSFLAGIDPTQLYRFPDFQIMVARSGLSGGMYSFTSSTPAWIPVYALMALSSPPVAKFLLTALGALLFVPLVHIAASVAKSSFRTAYIVFFSSSFALALNFRDGEPFLILTFLLLLAFFAFDMKAEAVTGIILGLIFPSETLAFIPALMFLLVARWRVFVYFVVAALISSGIIFVIVGQDTSIYYLQHVLPFNINGRVFNPYSSFHQTAWSFFRRLFLFNETLNPGPFISSTPAFIFSTSFFKAFVAVPSAYFFYKGIERNSLREALIAASFPIIFLSPTGSSVQMVLLAPAVVCLAQTALDEGKRKTAVSFIATYAAICVPLFTFFEDYLHLYSTITSYERFILLVVLYLVYLVFQSRLVPRESWTVRGAITGGLIAAVALTLYFGDHSVQMSAAPPIVPAMDAKLRERPSFSPAAGRTSITAITYDSDGRTFSPSDGSRDPKYGDCFSYAADRFGKVSGFGTIDDGKTFCGFNSQGKLTEFEGTSPMISIDGDRGAFVRNGSLYAIEIEGRRVSITDTVSFLPFRLSCGAFNSSIDDELVLVVDSLNGQSSIVTYNLRSRRESVQHLNFPVSHICADEDTFYVSEEVEDTTDIWTIPSISGLHSTEPRKLFSLRGDIIDLAVINHSIYFSSDFGRGLNWPTVYRYVGAGAGTEVRMH
ncbi:MAG TPA: glycosyltransferase 87 family protein [Candidatus Kryptonia bacterium]